MSAANIYRQGVWNEVGNVVANALKATHLGSRMVFGKPRVYKAYIALRSPSHAAVIRNSFIEATTDVRSLADESNTGNLNGIQQLVDILKNDPDATVG
jgi:hypothetical protein